MSHFPLLLELFVCVCVLWLVYFHCLSYVECYYLWCKKKINIKHKKIIEKNCHKLKRNSLNSNLCWKHGSPSLSQKKDKKKHQNISIVKSSSLLHNNLLLLFVCQWIFLCFLTILGERRGFSLNQGFSSPYWQYFK